MNEITVKLTRDQWALVLRLMDTGHCNDFYYAGMDEEYEAIQAAMTPQIGMTTQEAFEAEPERNHYVASGEPT